ncbi:MAG: ferrous iron transport protein B [Candidatus Pacebacteria bacterium]|nr:ferrous iron transport protein B [Candidatus Paceibacterota bacterium]
METKYDLTVGLIGNPNVGKTSLFNLLTGARQHVGNWPGKTVEKKEGEFNFEGRKINLVDLPGAYSLSAYTEEETVTSDFIFKEKPEAVVHVIDAQNLERNLLMTIHLIEMGSPLVVALNMVDRAEAKGIHINTAKLAELLGVPVVVINVRENRGIDELLRVVLKREARSISRSKINYEREVEEELEKLIQIVSFDKDIEKKNRKWLCLGLLEEDKNVAAIFADKPYSIELSAAQEKSIHHLQSVLDKDMGAGFARLRYGFIDGLIKETVTRKINKGKTITERLDDYALSRFWGIPLFLFVIFLVFQIFFKLSESASGFIRGGFHAIALGVTSLLSMWGMSDWTTSLVVDGIIGGVGNVLIFVPILGMLFLFIAILEDSGYMARIAFVMDRFMHKLGLHGKAFIPMILGFGCNVPGIMATRTLETRRDRLLAILINPFMSCGARLPVYILFAGIFFPEHQGVVIFSLYVLGILMAIIVGFIFRKFVFKELSSPFVIELPSYHIPSFKGVLIHAWERTWLFIKKAGTLILAFSVLIWFLASLPVGVAYGSEASLAGSFGRMLSPFFAPLGFGNWQATVALIFGLAGKEIIVGSFGTLYGASGDGSALSLASALRQDFTPLSSYAFMVFVLLYTPCIATLAAIKKETGSWKWTIFVATYSVIIAWLVAFVIYNFGRLLGF